MSWTQKNMRTRMKKILLYLIILTICQTAYSQTLSVFAPSSENYPIMQAKVYALDEDGKQLYNLSATDFKIKQGDDELQVLSVSCPTPRPPDAISSVLTIDISGSMQGHGLLKAKAAANAWINSLPLGKSECALTTFNQSNYLNQDFTTDKERLLQRVDELESAGGTSFNAGFIDKMSGALLIAERAKHKPVIVFLTDGQADGNEEEIIAKANEIGAEIYCVTLENEAPEILKNIAYATGGNYYENITSEADAEEIYLKILQTAQGAGPCEIEWMAKDCPTYVDTEFELTTNGTQSIINYEVPQNVLPALAVKPGQSIKFGGIIPGKSLRKDVTLYALNKQVIIDTITSNNDLFQFRGYSGEVITLNPGDSLTFQIKYSPKDSTYTFGKIKIVSNVCSGGFLYVSGGYPYSGIAEQTLFLTHPNGGEKFAAGSDTSITWVGLTPEDVILLEYSTDAGENWFLASDSAYGLEHRWSVPNTESSTCLMRAKAFDSNEKGTKTLSGHISEVSEITWSPDGTRLISDCEDRIMFLWDIDLGKSIHNFTTFLHYHSVAWSPDGNLIAYALSDYSVRLCDANATNYPEIQRLDGQPLWIKSIDWSPDSRMIASGGNGRDVVIWDTSSAVIQTLKGHSNVITKVRWSKDGDKLASVDEGGNLIIWDFDGGSADRTLQAHQGEALCLAWSPDDTRIATGGSDNLVKIWDVDAGNVVNTFSDHLGPVNAIDWDITGLRLASGDEEGKIIITDMEIETTALELTKHTRDIKDLKWSKSGAFLASGSSDHDIRIWSFEYFFQEDESDALWSIVIPEVEAKLIDFGTIALGDFRDSVVVGFLENKSDIPVRIDSIYIGGPIDYFRIISGLPPLTIEANGTASVEFGFHPKAVGNMTSSVVVHTQNDTLEYDLLGNAVDINIEITNKYVDFGKVFLGDRKDTLVAVLKNIGDKDIEIDSAAMLGPDKYQFKIIDGFQKQLVAAGDSLELQLSYIPQDSGRTNGVIGFYYDEIGSPTMVQLFGEGLTRCGKDAFFYPDFSFTDNLNLVGKARKSENRISITPSKALQTGGLWHTVMLDMTKGFQSTFVVEMNNGVKLGIDDGSSPGADGFAFVIQANTNEELGYGGYGMGYERIVNSLAVEFDSFANDDKQIENRHDPDGHHVAVQSRGLERNLAMHSDENTLAIAPDAIQLVADGRNYHIKIEYNYNHDSTFKVFVDTTGEFNEPVIELTDFDLGRYIDFIDEKYAFIGITASTGESYETHELLSWEYCPVKDTSSTSVEEEIADYDIKIFPNPGNNKIWIDIRANQFTQEIEIFNLYGDKVAALGQGIVRDGELYLWNSTEMPSGVYYCRIGTNNGVLSSKIMLLR
jgi:WD40 repeat protein